jgi:ribosome assembly protein 1
MTYHEASGEMIVAASGEVHLNHCLKDLGELYAKVPFKVSTPLVPFRETITAEFDRLYIEEFRKEEKAAHGLQQQQQQAKRDQNEDAVIDLSNASHEPRDKTMTFDITASTANKHFTITVTSRPLPKQITDFLEANGDRTRRFVDRVRVSQILREKF